MTVSDLLTDNLPQGFCFMPDVLGTVQLFGAGNGEKGSHTSPSFYGNDVYFTGFIHINESVNGHTGIAGNLVMADKKIHWLTE